MSLLKINEMDMVFISYDEPNAEMNYAKLVAIAPWAKRVHGVKGSDACHKAAADQSDTEWLVTVDADNIIDESFLDLEIDTTQYSDPQAFSWPGRNIINGLRYGNGSLKAWRREFIWNMRTHETAEAGMNDVDFCWESGYVPLSKSYSTTYINHSPLQAWRAGFREGVKMCLNRGLRCTGDTAKEAIWWENLHRLKMWLTIGAHVPNGDWAIAGAWEGMYLTMLTDWDIKHVRDFDTLNKMFEEIQYLMAPLERAGMMQEASKSFLSVPILDASTSEYVVDTVNEFYRLNRV